MSAQDVRTEDANSAASGAESPPEELPHLAFLRPYQRDAIRNVSLFYETGGTRALIVAITGSGKGSIAVAMIIEATRRGLRVMFVVHRTEILIEIARRLRELGILRISWIIGGAPGRYDPGAQIHLANIASVRHRALPGIDLLIEDESHRVLASTYLQLREQLGAKFVCGFTATPVRLDRKPLCLAYEKLFVAVQPSHLLEHPEWLARARVFSTDPAKRPDVSDVAKKGGDFDSRALSQRVNTKELVGDIVEHWQRRASDLTTIVFACDIEHSKSIVVAFIAAGVPAEHIDGEADGPERQALMQRLRDGATRVVCCMSLWLEGIDLPELKCAILARPTLSITVYLQGVGRIMRPWEGMNAVVLDHAGNVDRFGLPQADREWSIDPPERRKKASGPAPVKRCECGAEVALGTRVCPECGFDFPPPEAIQTVDGELVEVTKETDARAATEAAKRTAFNRFWLTAYKDGFDGFWVLRRFADRFAEAPPADWTPPDRPAVQYTIAQKHAQYTAWMGAAQRQRLPHSWVAEKYKNKYQSDPSELNAKPAEIPATSPTKTIEPTPLSSERVELEF